MILAEVHPEQSLIQDMAQKNTHIVTIEPIPKYSPL